MAPYCTSKFGLEGLSESLRRELLPFGVDVIVVAPGAVATPIWDKADETDTAAYAGTVYGPALDRLRAYMLSLGKSGLPPERIGEAVHTASPPPSPRSATRSRPSRCRC
jgi:NAD(P)-dependent dehydrogenase (short-subunit alcohol dehydrogenase family)